MIKTLNNIYYVIRNDGLFRAEPLHKYIYIYIVIQRHSYEACSAERPGACKLVLHKI